MGHIFVAYFCNEHTFVVLLSVLPQPVFFFFESGVKKKMKFVGGKMYCDEM